MRLTLTPEKPATFTLKLRLPGWVQGRPLPSDLNAYRSGPEAAWSLTRNRQLVEARPDASGYVPLRGQWQPGEVVSLELSMPVRTVVGHEKIAATRGEVAFERGPVVYCFEQADQDLPASVRVGAGVTERFQPEVLDGVVTLAVDGATAIPYHAWNNRGLAPMRVWVPETK